MACHFLPHANTASDSSKTTRIHQKVIYKANAQVGLLQRATSSLGVLRSTSATVMRALSKTVRIFKRCKLVILIKFGDLS